MKKFNLCSRPPPGCCPSVDPIGDKWQITTDDGKFVILTTKEIKILADKVLK